jgi:hypothetical protein
MRDDVKAILDRLLEIDDADTAFSKLAQPTSLKEAEEFVKRIVERKELHRKLQSLPSFKA